MEKNSEELLRQSKGLRWRKRHRIRRTKWIDKSSEEAEASLFSRFGIIASASTSESGPANLLECLHRGCVVVGNADWWDGYGFEETVFSYDPSRRQSNLHNLSYLLDPANLEEINRKREAVLVQHIERQDNEWSTVLDRLISIIQRQM